MSTVVRFCIISRRFCHIWKISQTLFTSRHLLDGDQSLSPSHPCDQVFFLERNKQRLRSKFLEGDIRCQAERCFHGDCCVMIKRTALILSTATLSFGLALASTALADDAMKKDTMSKDAMSKDSMKKDSVSKDAMSKDAMSKDTMSKDSMKNDEMKKN